MSPSETSWSPEAIDFINLLIQRKPANRLGLNGAQDVKNHPWFAEFDWEKLKRKELQAPYKPSPGEVNLDSRVQNKDNNEASNADMMALKQKSI